VVASWYAAPDVRRNGMSSEGDWVIWGMLTQSRVLCSPIVELRQCTLHPGQRETVIDLFDRAFVESQEALGAHGRRDWLDADDHRLA
jgi:hypothetical protein